MTGFRAACSFLSAATTGVALLLGAPASAQTATGDAVIPISAAACADMRRHHVLNSGAPVGCERLRLVRFGYIDFDGQPHDDGAVVVLDAVADHVVQIFAELRQARFPIAGADLMNAYDGDDDVSMARNNTSAFNVRNVAGGGGLSLHAYGVAIDINPVQNPYLRRSDGRLLVNPQTAAAYLNRNPLRPGMAEWAAASFLKHGFSTWGGHWRSPDYQHFQVSHGLAIRLARLPAAEASALFDRHVQEVRQQLRICVQRIGGNARATTAACRPLAPH
jgi:hypothetical protein